MNRNPPLDSLLRPLQEAIEELPSFVFETPQAAEPSLTAVQILARQSERHTKQLFRLNAAYEELVPLGQQLKQANDEKETARREHRRLAIASIQIIDALDWIGESLRERGDPFASEVDSACRDSLRRLAGSGVTEIPAEGRFDDRLHEGVGTVPATETQTPYQIVRVVRRGFQMGSDILRRTEVITAT